MLSVVSFDADLCPRMEILFFSIMTSFLFLNQLTKCLIFNGKEKKFIPPRNGLAHLNAVAQ